MTHHRRRADVEYALERYRKVTGDRGAVLIFEPRKHVYSDRDGTPREKAYGVFRVEGSQYLQDFEVSGAWVAWHALEMYCKGWEDCVLADVIGKAADSL